VRLVQRDPDTIAAGPICAALRKDFRDDDESFIGSIDGLERFRAELLAAIPATAT
jgi:hypothetical protein